MISSQFTPSPSPSSNSKHPTTSPPASPSSSCSAPPTSSSLSPVISDEVSFTLLNFSLIAASLSSMNFPRGQRGIVQLVHREHQEHNSTAMIGGVRLKSKRAAFSMSAASDGGEEVLGLTLRDVGKEKWVWVC